MRWVELKRCTYKRQNTGRCATKSVRAKELGIGALRSMMVPLVS